MPSSKQSVFSPLPFDKLDSIYAINLKDDFITAIAVADADPDVRLSSELEWTIDLIAGDSVPNVTVLASVAKHPGIISLGTGATTAATGDAAAIVLASVADADTFILDDNGVYLATILRLPDSTNTKLEFGLVAAAALPNSSAVDVVSLVFDPADAANTDDKLFFAQVNAANVDVEDVMSLALYDTNEWVVLEVAANNKGATFRVTTDNGSETASIVTTMPTVGLQPAIAISTIGNAEERVDIDAFQLRYLRRTQSAVVGA